MCIALGACILKYVLFLVNLVLTVFGLGILALGIFVMVKLQEAGIIGIIIIVIGCVITVIFFLGCCGAVTKNNCMLISYTVIIIIIATLTVVLTVFLAKQKGEITETISTELTEAFNSTESKETINSIEYALQCCGTTGPDSYANSTIPISCCPDAASHIQSIVTDGSNTNITNGVDSISICNSADAYQEGCVDIVIKEILRALNIAVDILICICVGEYVAGAIAIALTCYNRRKRGT